MKKSIVTAILVSAIMLVAGKASAQEENGFWMIDVKTDFTENGFKWFNDAKILVVGGKDKHNAMTISWGSVGMQGGCAVLTVYVAEEGHPKQFMDNNGYFTVMAFDTEHGERPKYMGSKSGRNSGKAATLRLHTAYTENGAPYYMEATHGDKM